MKSSKLKPSQIVIRVVVAAAAVPAVVLGVIVYRWLDEASRNLAKESVAPIVKILKDGGAVEKCSRGSTGKGFDNRSPNYAMVFETSLNREQATELAKRAASSNGYNLKTYENPYPEIVSLHDDSTKQSEFDELEKDYITLGMSLYDGGSHLSCENTRVKYDKEHTAIKLDISLPNYR